MESLENDMRKQISKRLKSNARYKRLFGKELICEDLPSFLTDKEERETVECFRSFTTYFKGFNTNRENMYSSDEKSTAIAYRCINDNLPRFLDNVKSFQKVFDNLSDETITKLNTDLYNTFGRNIEDIFSVDYFEFVLAQSGIDIYNSMIGGYTCSDGTKIQGLNECINLYNQQVAKNEKSKRLPLMKPLYKQILSEKDSVSFIPEKFNSDNEVLLAIEDYYAAHIGDIDSLTELLQSLDLYNTDGIFVKSGAAVSDISNGAFNSWNVLRLAWNEKYEALHPVSNVVYKLNGEAEMFYREASINDKEKITHQANQPIKNKNPDNEKKESTFEYDIIKDKRFTKRQFSLHVPITINFKAHGQEFLNYDVRKAVKYKDDNYVIGIDRGERNLIYISVINSNGKIVEQMSLNEIISDNGHRVDYQKLLDTKEKERDKARKNWTSVENIKELKEGYISQVVHKICELVVKYDAVIAMEDLNFGFKRGRFPVEKQVYQKFENMLISKLNLLIDKKADPTEDGGLLRAYQLTNKFDGVNKAKQNGIIFYVPAWDTSKIDPVTGFVNLLKPKYTSVSEAKKLFETIDDIKYNANTDMFEFCIDYGKFPRCNSDYKKTWTVCTNSSRILTCRNKEKNNMWDNKQIVLTDEFKSLFVEFGIDYKGNLKTSILSISNADFYRRLIKLLSLTLQMRNSITGSTLPEDDYLISPVANDRGEFYDSRNYKGTNAALPCDADANGAYNIARKALWAINVLKSTPDDMLNKANLSITNAEWLEYTQK